MRNDPELQKVFSRTPVRSKSAMDKTTAAAREMVDAEKTARDERTARLRALRMGQVEEDPISAGAKDI